MAGAFSFLYPGCMKQRCSRCKRMTPLTEMSTNTCSSCRKKYSSNPAKSREYISKWRKARYKAGDVFENRCGTHLRCEAKGLRSHEQRNVWQLVPMTLEARRLLRDLSMLEVYALPDQVLLDNFEVLCKYHYQWWLEDNEEAGCNIVVLKARSHTSKGESKM